MILRVFGGRPGSLDGKMDERMDGGIRMGIYLDRAG